MKHIISLFIISFFCISEIYAQSYIEKPEGELQYLKDSEIKPNETDGSYYNEHWNYHVMLNSGSEMYITYSISHFAGVRDAVSSARLTLINWEDENIEVARQYNLELLEFEEDTYKMNLHPERSIWIEGKPSENHRFYVRTKKDGIHFDISINFSSHYKGFTWGDGVFNLGDQDKVGMFTHFPFSEVSGFVALNFDTVQVDGFGTMTHTYQTNVGTRLFDRSFQFNTKTIDSFSGGYFMIPKDHTDEVIGYAYTIKNDTIKLKKPMRLEIQGDQNLAGERIAKSIQVDYEDAETDIFRIYEVSKKDAMLEELGGLKKFLAKRLLGGDILILRGAGLKGTQVISFTLSRSD